jgi:hypothetical protein
MAKRKAAREEIGANAKRALKALEKSLEGLGDLGEDVAEVRKNLRRYLDELEESLHQFPRLTPPPPPRLRPRLPARTRRR